MPFFLISQEIQSRDADPLRVLCRLGSNCQCVAPRAEAGKNVNTDP